jgi:hypothetical protein
MKDYGPRGVRVVGLAFEYTGERVQDAPRVRKFAERGGIRITQSLRRVG